MDVEVFLPEEDGEAARAALEAVMAAYPGLLRVRWHERPDPERYLQLWLAALAHSEEPFEATGYAGYGGYAATLAAAEMERPAVALYGRLALLPKPGGPPERVGRLPVYRVPFGIPAVLRAGFHRALEAALAELREAWRALLVFHPEGLDDEEAARLLETTPAALRRARGS